MSDDFVHDLELELTAAARRRAAAPPRRRPAIALRRGLPIVAVALVAAALVSIVALLARGDAERQAAQPPAGGTVPPGCAVPLPARLTDRLPLLGEAREPLPPEGVAVLRDGNWDVAAIDTRRAAFWGERDGLAIWIVPAVSRAADGPCAPADGACVVALADGRPPDAVCQAPPTANVRYAPLGEDRGVVFGFVAPGVTGLRVVAGSEETTMRARSGVVGGVAQFPFAPGVHLEPVRGG